MACDELEVALCRALRVDGEVRRVEGNAREVIYVFARR